MSAVNAISRCYESCRGPQLFLGVCAAGSRVPLVLDGAPTVSAAPYPGTALHREALERGWLNGNGLVDGHGVQSAALGYPDLPREEIFAALETFYRRFYFRPRKIMAIGAEMIRDPSMGRRRLREGRDFLRFLSRRRARHTS